ncbi:MAG TPA: hypothetical protein VGL00_05820 [Terracidiphilus sp.]
MGERRTPALVPAQEYAAAAKVAAQGAVPEAPAVWVVVPPMAAPRARAAPAAVGELLRPASRQTGT